MRKFRSLFMMLLTVASMSVLTSCGDDDEPNPKATITFDPSAETVNAAPGEALNVKFVVTSSDNLKSFVVTRSTGGEVANVDDFPDAGYQYHLTEIVPTTAAVGSSIVYTITVETKKDEVTTRTFTVNVVAEINTFSARVMGNQNAAVGSFLSSSTGVVYNSADAKTNSSLIDLAFYFSSPTSGDPVAATNAATIASPSDAKAQQIHTGIPTWVTKNTTELKFLGTGTTAVGAFDAATKKSEIETVYTSSTTAASTFVNKLKVNDVFGFKTATGKYGVAKVVALSALTVNNASEIKLDVKVQR